MTVITVYTTVYCVQSQTCLVTGDLWCGSDDTQLCRQVAGIGPWCPHPPWVCTICWLWESAEATVGFHPRRQRLHAAGLAVDTDSESRISKGPPIQRCSLRYEVHGGAVYRRAQTSVALPPHRAACFTAEGVQDDRGMRRLTQPSHEAVHRARLVQGWVTASGQVNCLNT